MSVRPARHAGRAAILATLCSAIFVLTAEAQVRPAPPKPTGPTPEAGSWEIGGGGTFVGGFDLGEAAAELTRNTTTPGSGPFTLFVTDASVESAMALQGRLAYYFTPQFAIEGGVRFGQPVLTIELSGDAEGAPDVTAEETIDQYVFSGSALWHFGRPTPRTRAVPFIFGGAGYLRELHEGQELVETGMEYHGGAGVKYWFGNARRRFGLRGDAGVSFRDGGVDPDESFRLVPILSASLIYLF
jgi:hypothetical protein